MSEEFENFKQFRQKMDQKILNKAPKEIKRFYALDKNAYKEGALSAETKELLGLVGSLVLRCSECITYHLWRCIRLGLSDEQLFEAFHISLVVGGSIVIPHLRQAVSMLEEIRTAENKTD